MSFTKSIGETISTSVTKGIEASQELDFFIDDTKVKVSLNGTIAEQHSNTKEYTVPVQTVKVPPHSQVKVTAYWSQVQILQKVKTSCKLSGTVTGKCYVHSTIPSEEGMKEVWNENYSLSNVFSPYMIGSYVTYPGMPTCLTANHDSSGTLSFTGGIDFYGVKAGSLFQVNVGKSEPIEE